MKFTATREDILSPLQNVIGVVERRQTMPVLSNVLIGARNNRLSMTGTDLEVELVSSRELQVAQAGDLTVPGRKFLDILKSLPEGTPITIATDGERLSIRAGRSRFTLAMLPAAEFPVVDEISAQQTLTVPQAEFRRLIDKTHFSMAQQDVRYYLNGLLLEAEGKILRAVATDGHRLSLCETALETKVAARQQVIIPRKGVGELQRLLGSDGNIELQIGTNHVRATIGEVRFTSKLIDGRFPEYGRVIPAAPTKKVEADCQTLRQALQRTAILSNEKYRGIRLALKTNQLTLLAHNPEQEEAEDQIEVDYTGEDLEIGFNVNYLLDALGAIDGDRVQIGLSDSNSSGLLTQPGSMAAKYVVMPMRL
jgi:DNA polymerase III subunit beta